jgi:hypothetical protein
MYTRKQASVIKQQFWTRFGQYMAPVPSESGEKINWINYKTGIRNLYFKMDVTENEALVYIEIAHKDQDFALKIYDQFFLLKTALEADFQKHLSWNRLTENGHHQSMSTIVAVQKNCNVFTENDWPEMISFLKEGIIGLDKFWYHHQMIFEMIG